MTKSQEKALEAAKEFLDRKFRGTTIYEGHPLTTLYELLEAALSPQEALNLEELKAEIGNKILEQRADWPQACEIAFMTIDFLAPYLVDKRSCTCHPDDNPPVPCAGKYALSECAQPPAYDVNGELLEALKKIRLTPSMPFPDPGAHSERAFSDAVWRAWSRIQHIAAAAIANAEAAMKPAYERIEGLDEALHCATYELNKEFSSEMAKVFEAARRYARQHASAATEGPDWKGAYESECQKFQQETRRTSELSVMLRKIVEVVKEHCGHTPGPWSRGCWRCELVQEAETLLAKPINEAAIPEGEK